MFINKLVISNFKGYKSFELSFNDSVNVIVGNNNEGKTTIFEAINMALTATLNGKNVLSEIPGYLFNNEIVAEYLNQIQKGEKATPPTAFVELYFTDKVENGYYIGNNNSKQEKCAGVKIIFELNPDCREEYEEYIKFEKDVKTLPVEFYHCNWYTFADNAVVKVSLPVRSNYIDISTSRFLSGPDKQVLQIVENTLSVKDRTALSVSYRKLRERFSEEQNISTLNKQISEKYHDISDKSLSLNIEVSSKTNWETNFTTFFDDIPFSQIGKGEQSTFKIKLALSSQKDKCNVILIEEPENHLSYANMSALIDDIIALSSDTQVIITTHSTFVLNKLNLKKVILLQNGKKTLLTDLQDDTVEYFEKMPGYDTLRLILAKKVILVEGPSDELIVQKLYKQKHGKLPIEDGVDVISVRGTSFARFLEIAKNLGTKVVVVPDNDKKAESKLKKYGAYINDSIRLAMSQDNNLFTLEKILIHFNGKDFLNSIFGKSFSSDDELLEYMTDNKSDCALQIFKSEKTIKYANEVYDAL